MGVANIKEICKIAKIDNSDAYRQIEKLESKSLVEKILDFPNKYKPTPLNEALNVLIKEKNRQNAELQEKVETLLKKGKSPKPSGKVENMISLVPDGKFFRAKVIRNLEHAQKESRWYSSITQISRKIEEYHEIMEKLRMRKFRWRVIAELDDRTEGRIRYISEYQKQNPNFDIRYTNANLDVGFSIWDDCKLMQFDTSPLSELPKNNEKILITDNAQLISIFREYFDWKWNSAMKKYPKNDR